MSDENDLIQTALMRDKLAGLRMDHGDIAGAMEALDYQKGNTMTNEQIKHMTDRFLQWKLPEHFHPDAGISFNPRYNVDNIHGWPEGKHEPVGTNLLSADQAEQMVRFMLESLPQPPSS